MEKGAYKGHHVDFRKYMVSCFNPYLFTDQLLWLTGCGATALALITGVSPAKILELNGHKHYPDKFMTGFLRQRQYDLLPLTQCLLSETSSQIGPSHVVLLSQLILRNEATWGVIFDGIYYHNFQGYQIDGLSFLNKPVLTAYSVWHPRWCPMRSTKAAPSRKPKLKPAGYTLKDLRLARSARQVLRQVIQL